jgi:hypothetical protein
LSLEIGVRLRRSSRVKWILLILISFQASFLPGCLIYICWSISCWSINEAWKLLVCYSY